MGEKQNRPFQLSFNASLKVGFQGSRVTSDGGLILVRSLDARLKFSKLIAEHLRKRFCCSSQQNLHPLSFYTLISTSPTTRWRDGLTWQRGGDTVPGLR
jgi:hypothetical protein